MTNVSILGTGLMGAAMTRVLLRNGYSVTVWNRSPAKASHLEQEGAVIANSATEAIASSPIVILVIQSYDNVRALLADALEALEDGAIGDVVNVVTGSPTEADELDAWAQENGIRLLDGALLTYPKGLGNEDTVVMYSGDEGVWRRTETILRKIAGGSQYLGPQARLANAVDHMTLSFTTVAQTAIFATLAYAQALGVPREQAVARLHRSLRNMSGYLDYALPKINSGDFSTAEATIDTWALATRDLPRDWKDAGLPGKAIAAAAETLRDAQEAGLGGFDLAALYQFELDQTDSST